MKRVTRRPAGEVENVLVDKCVGEEGGGVCRKGVAVGLIVEVGIRDAKMEVAAAFGIDKLIAVLEIHKLDVGAPIEIVEELARFATLEGLGTREDGVIDTTSGLAREEREVG